MAVEKLATIGQATTATPSTPALNVPLSHSTVTEPLDHTADSAGVVSQTCDRAGIPTQRVTTATEVDLEGR